MNEKINVLVVDDSSLMRKLISAMINSDPELTVSDVAMNGYFALQKIEKNPPDIILLDIEMPQMNGIEFLHKWKELKIGIPVVVLSSLGRNRPELTLECIDLGAKDFILKPSGTISLDIENVKEEVIAKIKYFYRFSPVTKTGVPVQGLKESIEKIEKSDNITNYYKIPVKEVKAEHHLEKETSDELEKKLSKGKNFSIIAIGISTGGPNALREILPMFPADFKIPIAIVQHMPAGFTKEFAKGLDEICSLKVKEAEDFDPLEEGHVYIAPGDKHIVIESKGMGNLIRFDDTPPTNGHRPSVEILFNSVADNLGSKSIGIIMTGMGKDGARAIKRIRLKGGITVAQSEKTCVVFGMPKVALEEGGIDEICDLLDIPKRVLQFVGYKPERA